MKGIAFLLFAFVGLVASSKWGVKDSSDQYCIVLEAATTVNLAYSTENGTETCQVEIRDEDVVGVDGKCSAVHDGKEAQTISVKFTPKSDPSLQEWILDLIFTKTDSGYKISDYSVTSAPNPVCAQIASITKFNMLSNSTNEVVASGSNGFQCSKSALALVNGSSVDFKGLRTVAFTQLNTTDIPASQGFDLCFLDTRTSDIVPIIVGACLACLVIIVLVAYLIGRARARRQGYASV